MLTGVSSLHSFNAWFNWWRVTTIWETQPRQALRRLSFP